MFIEKNYILFYLLNTVMFMVILGVMLFVAKWRGVKAESVDTSQAKKRFVSQIVFHVAMFLISTLPEHVTIVPRKYSSETNLVKNCLYGIVLISFYWLNFLDE